MNYSKTLLAFEQLLEMMDVLRTQCPWDKKQTIDSLRHLSIEEVYELSDAILQGDSEELKSELGDILLHIIFYAKIASEKKDFDMKDVIESLCQKLKRRHPHIYGEVSATSEEEVKKNWEQIKLQEGQESILAGVPRSLPSMVKSYRIQEKVSSVGFDWDNADDVLQKVKEEIEELQVEIKQKNHQAIESELGDVFFSLINYARFLKIEPEAALERTNKKFIKRFQFLETHSPRPLVELSLEEMDALWEEAKKEFRS